LAARHTYGHGPQIDYFDHFSTVGWTRLGTEENPGGMAVVMSNSAAGKKKMNTGQPNRTYIDITGQINEPTVTDSEGWAEFCCEAGSVSVWVPEPVF